MFDFSKLSPKTLEVLYFMHGVHDAGVEICSRFLHSKNPDEEQLVDRVQRLARKRKVSGVNIRESVHI